jgi:hypothetical protein
LGDTANAKRQTPNAKRQTPNAKRFGKSPNFWVYQLYWLQCLQACVAASVGFTRDGVEKLLAQY